MNKVRFQSLREYCKIRINQPGRSQARFGSIFGFYHRGEEIVMDERSAGPPRNRGPPAARLPNMLKTHQRRGSWRFSHGLRSDQGGWNTKSSTLDLTPEINVMSNVLALSIIVAFAAPLGATTGYLIARRRQVGAKAHSHPQLGRLRRLALNLLGSIVGGVISSVTSYAMVAFGIPGMLVDWASRIFGA
jgi:hypothetical protein